MTDILESVKELIQVVELKPGDILVVRADERLLEREQADIRAKVTGAVRNACGAEVGVIVLDSGMELAVLRNDP